LLLDLFSGFLVDDEVPDCDPATVADAGALVLILGIVIAAIVIVVGIVMAVILILGGWVRVGCARLLCGHEAPPRGPEPGSARTLARLNV